MVSYLQTRVHNVLCAKMKGRILAVWHIVRATKLLIGTSARVQSETSAIGNGDNRPRCHSRPSLTYNLNVEKKFGCFLTSTSKKRLSTEPREVSASDFDETEIC